MVAPFRLNVCDSFALGVFLAYLGLNIRFNFYKEIKCTPISPGFIFCNNLVCSCSSEC